MNISNWYNDLLVENEATRGEATLLPQRAEIYLKKDNYSLMSVSCKITEFDINRYISFRLPLEYCDCKVDIIASWMKDNNELFKEYIDENKDICPFKDANELIITVLVYGSKGGYAKLNLPVIEEGKNITKRTANVASLCIDYGFVWEHRLRTGDDNLNETLERIDALCKESNPDLVVLTETFMARNTGVDYLSSYIGIDSPHIMKLREKAKEHNIYLSFSFREKDKKGCIYNSALVIDRKGDIIANYHKTHLTMNEKLKGVTPGDEIVVVDTDFGKCGIAICWDLYYPEFIRTLKKKGAEIIINPSAGYHKDMHSLRAKENGVYIVTSGTYRDRTVVIDPDGTILSDGLMTGAAFATINLDERFPIRYLSCNSYAERKNVYFNEMRPDLYNF